MSEDRNPDIAKGYREIFIPEEGCLWACNDYSQQEPRWTIHYAALAGCTKGVEAQQRFIDDPKVDNHEMMVRIALGDEKVDYLLEHDPEQFKFIRRQKKDIFLGLCYGEGPVLLCKNLGLKTRWKFVMWNDGYKHEEFCMNKEDAQYVLKRARRGKIFECAGEEGQRVFDEFHQQVPYVKELTTMAMDQVKKRGYVTTALGRRCNFRRMDDGYYVQQHSALNKVIQGSSSDQGKQAIIDAYRAGHIIHIPVHDEIDTSAETEKQALEVAGIMRRVTDYFPVEVKIPFNVDTEVGDSWGNIKKISG